MQNFDKTPNALLNETSPYLLQHAWNPVNWLPWGEEAFSTAQSQNKLIIISIGYSACHWCHVMERECFEDEEVAVQMNRDFVSIKVDREERPDVDAVYMDAVQLMRGQGGWPLNAICLPDGTPIYGGTYFPKPNWMGVLRQLSELWRNEPGRAREYASQLREGLMGMEVSDVPSGHFAPDKAWLQATIDGFRSRIDREHGGMDKAPKFPMPVNLRYMLEAGILAGAEDLIAHVHLTLRRMAHGGIYDAVGGGFARYSVDRIWLAPHFEKMLYDNAQLIGVYADAYRNLPDPGYARVIRETIGWLNREMLAPEGLFFSALDADSEGIEGKYYTWTLTEWNDVLGEDAEWAAAFWNITREGNWEHTNIMYQAGSAAELATRLHISETEALLKIETVKKRLLERRNSRVRPGLDNKRLLSWNALAISGLVSAWKALGDDTYKELAMRVAGACIETFYRDGRLLRTSAGGPARIHGLLEDYALFADALLDISEIDANERWITLAQRLIETANHWFSHSGQGLYYFAPEDTRDLILRKKEIYDNVIPSSNGVLAHVQRTLWLLTGNPGYRDGYTRALDQVGPEISTVPTAYANWARLALYEICQPEEWVFTNAADQARLAHTPFVPGRRIWNLESNQDHIPSWSGKYVEGQQRLYRCHAGSCAEPVTL